MEIGKKGRAAVLIAGPTASGKSAVALELARTHPAVVINADALQVYRELRLLTARPSEEQEREIPHRLYGFVPACEAFSAGRWLIAARRAIEESWALDRIPIIVGGTGLYFKALEYGLVRLPPVSPAVRERLRQELKSRGAEALHAELAALDPMEAHRVRPSDGHRIVRALEVIQSSGRSLADWQRKSEEGSPLAGCKAMRLYISPPRELLYRSIEERFDEMMRAGALDEVRALLESTSSPQLPIMKAIGIRELALALSGELSMSEACRIAKRNTRHYAKRQLTWARSNMMSWKWLTEQFLVQSKQEFFNFISLAA
jgi:tRNA dimethylallyltransferase